MDYLPTYADSLKNRDTNVIKEFFKLYKLADNDVCSNCSLFDLVSSSFEDLNKYSSEFIDAYDCLDDILDDILDYEDLSKINKLNIDEESLQHFTLIYRNYCTFIMDLICKYQNDYMRYSNDYLYDAKIKSINKFKKMLNNGLQKLGYGINYDEEYCKFYVLNQKAEAIAHVCREKDSNNIFNYLAATTLEEKQEILTILAVDAESIEFKYLSVPLIEDAKRYSQTLRHITNIKSDDPQYTWFFKDKEKGLDMIFDMILFVHDYDHAHNISKNIKKEITQANNAKTDASK